MSEDSREQRAILVVAANSSAAVKELYAWYKRTHLKVSLAQICKKAHISSKGYLADIMAGRRTLNLSYQESLGTALGLSGLNLKYFRLLVELDHEDGGPRRATLYEELESIRKSFAITFSPKPLHAWPGKKAFEVYCAFGLFAHEPTAADLLAYFGQKDEGAILQSLEALIEGGFVSLDGETKRYRLNENHMIMVGSDESHKHFLSESIQDGMQKIDQWAQDKVDAHFESVIISVNKTHYRRLLQRIKHDLLQWQSELETHDADAIVRFNIQIYPVS